MTLPPDAAEEQPSRHEIGSRTYLVADVPPIDVDGVRTLQVGTALWALLGLALLPFHQRLDDSGHGWWPWVCLVGVVLGLAGGAYCRRRRTQRFRASRQQPARTQG